LVREVVRQQNLPLEIHLVSDGAAAIDFIERSDKEETAPAPDLLLLDLNLPKMEGFEVLQRVRESPRSRNIPVLIITSSDSPADRDNAQRRGAYYFKKPPSYESFLKLGDVLKEILREHGMWEGQ